MVRANCRYLQGWFCSPRLTNQLDRQSRCQYSFMVDKTAYFVLIAPRYIGKRRSHFGMRPEFC
ncbi:MAG: hypothetical protein F6K24_08365 [Okeania sp. SIO2D1]|nr:hypothetical protein [Okeania sp. SIO2D1]